MSNSLKNMYTALITPFLENGEVDYETLKKLLYKQEKSKIDGIAILSTTGESSTLKYEECIKILTITKEIFKRDIIIGISENDPLKAINKIKKYEKYHPIAFLVCAPFYNKGNKEGIYKFYKLIIDNISSNIILYNVPSRCGYDIDIRVIKKLSKEKKVIGIKNASYNYKYYEDLAVLQNKYFKVLCGNDDFFFVGMNLTNSGIISVATNLIPNYFVSLFNAYITNKKSVLNDYLSLKPLLNILNRDINPLMIKELMSEFALCKSITRIPLKNKKHHYVLDLRRMLKERRIYDECYFNR